MFLVKAFENEQNMQLASLICVSILSSRIPRLYIYDGETRKIKLRIYILSFFT